MTSIREDDIREEIIEIVEEKGVISTGRLIQLQTGPAKEALDILAELIAEGELEIRKDEKIVRADPSDQTSLI